jgi:hypothetical protein
MLHVCHGTNLDPEYLDGPNSVFGIETVIRWKGKEKNECKITIKGGQIVYDLKGLAEPLFVMSGRMNRSM